MTFSTSDVLPLQAGHVVVPRARHRLQPADRRAADDAGPIRRSSSSRSRSSRSSPRRQEEVQGPSVVMARRVDADLGFALALADAADALTLRALPRGRPARRDEARPDAGHRRRPGGRAGAARAHRRASGPARACSARRKATTAGADRWIVDPIDGTRNFSRGIPVWATLLALERDGELVLRRRLGARARAALVGGARRGRVRERRARSASRRSRRSPTRPSRARDARATSRGSSRSSGTRAASAISGSTCSSPRARSTRRVDAELALWDRAALEPIVEEAGGRVG